MVFDVEVGRDFIMFTRSFLRLSRTRGEGNTSGDAARHDDAEQELWSPGTRPRS